jgi:hypothetical protein
MKPKSFAGHRPMLWALALQSHSLGTSA